MRKKLFITSKKSFVALNAIRLIRKYFTQKELIQLLTSNFYSILFYNSEIWHLPSLKATLKQKLLSASSKALRVCWKKLDTEMSFVNLHKILKRATPDQYMKCKLSLCVYKLHNQTSCNTLEFLRLNLNQIFTSRQVKFICSKGNIQQIGLNCLVNRFHILNNLIPLDWLSGSLNSFKIKCKELFLST